ncbi:MAG: DMT family transporter [Acetanaerobacterium sp.]
MNNKHKDGLSVAFAFMGYAIFGFSFIFSKRALDITTPFVLLSVRFTVAFLILNCILAVKRIKLNIKKPQIGLLLLLGILQPVCYFIFESYAVTLVSTSFVGTVVALVPVASVVFGFMLLQERVTPFQIIWSCLSVAGVFLTTFGQPAGTFSLVGLMLLLGAVCTTSLYNVLSRKISNEFGTFERTYVMFGLGSITFTSIALIQSRSSFTELVIAPLCNPDFWVPVVFLAGASSVGAFLMLNYAMTHISVARASIFANMTTVISILAGVLILKESFGTYQVIGSAIVVVSAYCVNRPRKRNPSAQATIKTEMQHSIPREEP